MFECKICGRNLDKVGNLKQHIKKCEKLSVIKDEIVRLYVDESYSVKDLRKKFQIQSEDIKDILGNKVRSSSESNKLAHMKYPENFKHIPKKVKK